MALALYRKYRPQTFKEITDQNHVKIILEQEVARGKVAHAYLFSGPRGVGKTSLARIFAKAVNCMKRKDGAGEPCNKCEACTTITEGRALDVIEIDAASYTGVDTVRETIIETAKFAPSRLKCKVFIIDEVHMLSTSAWNALLKIMEEPPTHVIFILATTEVHKVPATILSRCQRFDFHRIRPPDLIERLKFIASQEHVKVSTPVLQAVARLSEGCVRDAESILEQLLSLGEKEITEDVASIVLPRTSTPAVLDFLEVLLASDTKRGIELVNRYLEEGFDIAQFSGDILEMLRKMLIILTAGSEVIAGSVDATTLQRLQEFAKRAGVSRTLTLIDAFVKAKQGLKGASIPQLPLELAVVEVCGLEAGPGSAVSQLQGSSFAPTAPRVGAADAPKIAPPHRQAAPLGGVDKDKKLRSASATLLLQTTAGKQPTRILLEEIKSKWPEVLKKVHEENHSLPFLLSTSEPVEIEGDIVHVGVAYPFHRDKLNEEKSRAVLEKVLASEFKIPLRVQGVVFARKPAATAAVEDILNTLGGKIIE